MTSENSKGVILIVDDTPDNLRLLSQMLTEKGYHVRAVKSGKEALSSISASQPDIILLDVMMPGMDGFEVCTELKSSEVTRDIPVIFLSALNNTRDKIKGFEAGGIDYITKPFQHEEVLTRVQTHLNASLMRSRIDLLLQRQEALLGAVPNIIMEVDNLKRYSWANQAGIDFFGDDVIGREAADYFEGDQDTYDIVQPLFEGAESVFYLESWQRRHDGQKRLLGWWCRVLKDGSGKVTGAISSAQDITIFKQTAAELKKTNENLEHLVRERTSELIKSKLFLDETARLARVGGWELDLKTGEQIWTDMVYEIHELGKDFNPTLDNGINFYSPESLPAISEAVRAAIDHEKPFDLELQIITAKKNRIWVRSVGNSFHENGKAVKLAGVFQDINERKLIEIELQKYRLNLEELVSQRTSELAQAVENLERSNQDLEQFAYVASHDLQEPLRMVSSYTQLLERRYKDRLDQDANDFIQFAVDGANRMQKLINDLLDYSRITTRGKPFSAFDSSGILGQALANLQQAIIESTALISNTDLPVITGDETQIVRVFQNLIENAIKFKHENESPMIHISCRELDDCFEFAVRDNGIGIEEKYRERVFVIFQRLQSRADYPGTGIGLSICKRIVERHGGKIWFESDDTVGSTFYFTIQKVEK